MFMLWLHKLQPELPVPLCANYVELWHVCMPQWQHWGAHQLSLVRKSGTNSKSLVYKYKMAKKGFVLAAGCGNPGEQHCGAHW